MPDYMEFPAITAATLEGKIQQIADYLIRFQEKHNQLQEKYNQLVEEVEKLKEN